MSGKVKGKRRPGRPAGSKNKVKKNGFSPEQADSIPKPIVRKPLTRVTEPRGFTKATAFLVVDPKHLRLIQKWSKETKIGQQQVFDDIFLAGASAAYKSFYKGLINSRKAAEAQFDAETNTEVVGDKPGAETENNGSPDSVMPRSVVRRGDDEEQPSLAPVGPGHIEETDADLGEPARVEGMMQGIIDAPPTIAPKEEQVEEDDDGDDEPPY